MNKRLREFEKESKLEIFGLGARRDVWEKALEKYAELIIKECIKEAWDEIVSDEDIAAETDPQIREYLIGQNQGIVDAVIRFRNHFGVTESQGWVCPKCGIDRTKKVCPNGHTAAITGDCPMTAEAQ